MMEILIFMMVFLIILACVAIFVESRDYNNGLCPRCGAELRHFDTDSQGGRGYCCDACGYSTWVSCGIVDKDFKEENDE